MTIDRLKIIRTENILKHSSFDCAYIMTTYCPISDYDLYQVSIYENAKEEYFSFCSPECKHAIDEYLNYRERFGERVTPKSPLFREQFAIAKPKPIQSTGIEASLDRTLVKSGLRVIEHQTETENEIITSVANNKGKVRKDVSRFNGFRKFFNTNLVRAKVNPAVKEMLMGRSIDLDDNYYRPGSEEIMQEYLKAVNLLTINEENRLRMELSDVCLRLDRLDKVEENMCELNKRLGFT
jgi:hypothetical protein